MSRFYSYVESTSRIHFYEGGNKATVSSIGYADVKSEYQNFLPARFTFSETAQSGAFPINDCRICVTTPIPNDQSSTIENVTNCFPIYFKSGRLLYCMGDLTDPTKTTCGVYDKVSE